MTAATGRLEELLTPEVSREVLGVLMRGLTARVRTDGAPVPAWAEVVCSALAARGDAASPVLLRGMSVSGPATGSVGSSAWVTTGQAATLTGCSERHARRLAASGQVVARRVGSRSWLIDRDSLITVLRRAA